MNLISHIRNSMKYFQKGDTPSLLILSGTHGDEFRVIESVTAYIDKNYSSLPDFLFVPEVSPSAVKRKTRLNCRNVDLNRIFTGTIHDEESTSLKEIIDPFHFHLCLSLHEDPDQHAFYMYDSGTFEPSKLSQFKHSLLAAGVSLFSGIDDPDDPILGNMIKEGYYSINPTYDFSGGFIMDYAIKNNICDRFITLEIPGKVDQEENKRITSVVMNALRLALGF